MDFTVNKIEKIKFEYYTQIQDIKSQIEFIERQLKAAKNYLKGLEKFGPKINKFQAQDLMDTYEMERNTY